MSDIDKNNNPAPLFPCRNRGCAEEVSYPADMLAMHPEGGVVCQACWDNEQWPVNTPQEEWLYWNELQRFVPISVNGEPSDE